MGMTDDLEGYIRDNRGRYTDQAIRDRLVEAGHDPDEVDAALARAPAEPVDPGARGVATVLLAMVAVAAYVGASLLALAATGMGGSYGPRGAQVAVLVVYSIVMVVALVLVVRRMGRALGPMGTWMDVGAGFVVAVLVFIGLSGTCMAGLTQLR
jgi:hypothetical protein